MDNSTASGNTPGRRDWEDLGRLDPLWAILSEPGRRLGGWDERAFFASGQQEIDLVVDKARAMGFTRRERALDVGCGVGRLTRALSTHFDGVVGVDISEAMLKRARALHEEAPNVDFIQVAADQLSQLPQDHFDLAFSSIVLQHLSSPQDVLLALVGMLETIRPGGLLVAQTTSYTPPRHRVQLRPRAYALLRSLGVPPSVLYRRLRLHPVRIVAVAPADVRRRLEAAGGRILEEAIQTHDVGTVWTTYWVSKDPTSQ